MNLMEHCHHVLEFKVAERFTFADIVDDLHELTDFHWENLELLETYLSGELRTRFSMVDFTDAGNWHDHCLTCGTVGCAVGHGPFAGVPKNSEESWMEYSFRCFVPGTFSCRNGLWEYLFHGDWRHGESTAIQAADRIRRVLDYARNN